MNDKHKLDMLALNNTTNYTNLDCPVYGDTSEEWIDFYNFWVSGVLSTCIAIPGFIGELLQSILIFFSDSDMI